MTAGQKIIGALLEAQAHTFGGSAGVSEHHVKIPDMVDVKSIRARLNLSQAEFALRFGFSIDTVRNWEQSKRSPEASARALLTIIDKEPEAVKRALAM
jgi:putative transcriptional regulator